MLSCYNKKSLSTSIYLLTHRQKHTPLLYTLLKCFLNFVVAVVYYYYILDKWMEFYIPTICSGKGRWRETSVVSMESLLLGWCSKYCTATKRFIVVVCESWIHNCNDVGTLVNINLLHNKRCIYHDKLYFAMLLFRIWII